MGCFKENVLWNRLRYRQYMANICLKFLFTLPVVSAGLRTRQVCLHTWILPYGNLR